MTSYRMSDGTYFITDGFCCVAVFFSFGTFAFWRTWLCCLIVLELVSSPICPSICSNTRPNALSILPRTDSITHSYSLTKRVLLLGKWYDGLSNLKTSSSMCFPLLTMVFQKNIWLWQESGQCFSCSSGATCVLMKPLRCSGLYLCWLRVPEWAPLCGDSD